MPGREERSCYLSHFILLEGDIIIAVKKFVPMIAKFEENEKITPVKIFWVDGRIFDIECIFDIRPRSSLKSGGHGTRFLCRIKNKDDYVYYEKPRWFVESKEH